MRNGIWIAGIAAAVFGIAALNDVRAPGWTWLVSIILSVFVALLCRRIAGVQAPRSAEKRKRIKRTIALWSVIEGVFIFAAVNVLANIGRSTLLLAAICLVVGLHFFPVARVLAVRVLCATASLMTVLGLAGLLQAHIVSSPVVGFGAAALLYLSSLASVLDRPPGVTRRQVLP